MVNKMKVSKYHGCENVFLIVDYEASVDFQKLSTQLCNSFLADGMIVFKNDPIEMIFYNKDGSLAKMCGNGIRCLMHYLYHKFNIYKYLKVKIADNFYECQINHINPFIVTVALGLGDYVSDIINKKIVVDDKEFVVSAFEIGVKHLVVISEDFNEDLPYIEKIFNHELFNREYNINFVKYLTNDTFEIVTYEKGVGLTKGCGTGAAASAYILHTEYMMDKNLTAINQGGILKIDIEEEIFLTGESKFVCEYEV